MKHHRLAQSNSIKSHSKLFHYKKLLQIYRFTFNSANLQQLFCMNTKQKDDYTDSLVMRPSVDYQQRCILFYYCPLKVLIRRKKGLIL